MVLVAVVEHGGFSDCCLNEDFPLLVLFYQGLLRSFGHFNHDEMLAVYCLAVLAFTPCGDAFSLDSRLAKARKERPAFAYAYPILLMQLLMAWTYFSSALIKLRVAGLKYLSPDNLPALAIFHSLDNLHDTQLSSGLLVTAGKGLSAVRSWVCAHLGTGSFRSLIFWRRLRWWILGFGIVFHLSTLFLMNIFFPHHLAMYLIFVDWDRCRRTSQRIFAKR